MTNEARTAQEQLTPEARRGLLRAFADRMLLKVTAMDDPEDMPGVEKAVRVAAVIERIYYRCDRSEQQTPEPHKVEAERAHHANDAIKAKVVLAQTLEWSDKRRKDLGTWWDAAQETVAEPVTPAPVQPVVVVQKAPAQTAETRETAKAPAAPAAPAEDRDPWNEIPPPPPPGHDDIDRTEDIRRMRAVLGLPPVPGEENPYFEACSTAPP